MITRVRYRVYVVLRWFNNKLNSSFYWMLLISMEVDIFLGGWILIKSLEEKIPMNYFGNVVVMVVVIHLGWLIVALLRTHYKYIVPSRENRMDIVKKYLYEKYNRGFLPMFSGFKPEFKYAAFLISFYILKDMAIPALLIFGVFSPFVQIPPFFVI